MNFQAVNLQEKLDKFNDQWSPKIIAEMNNVQFKLAKVAGEFVWHKHDQTDELFMVINGSLVIEFRDGRVPLSAGELFVVPKGVEHRPVAEKECHILLAEPRGVINTGDTGGDLTAENDVWI